MAHLQWAIWIPVVYETARTPVQRAYTVHPSATGVPFFLDPKLSIPMPTAALNPIKTHKTDRTAAA